MAMRHDLLSCVPFALSRPAIPDGLIAPRETLADRAPSPVFSFRLLLLAILVIYTGEQPNNHWCGIASECTDKLSR